MRQCRSPTRCPEPEWMSFFGRTSALDGAVAEAQAHPARVLVVDADADVDVDDSTDIGAAGSAVASTEGWR